MARASSDPWVFTDRDGVPIPPGSIIVSTQNNSQGGAPEPIWERKLRDAIEARSTFKTYITDPPSLGASAGGPRDMLEQIGQLGQDANRWYRLVKAIHAFVRRRSDRKLESRLPKPNCLEVRIHTWPSDRTQAERWLTLEDLVALVPTIRDTLDERGNYQLELSAQHRNPRGRTSVLGLTAKDLRSGRRMQRLQTFARDVQGEGKEYTITVGELRSQGKFHPDPVS